MKTRTDNLLSTEDSKLINDIQQEFEKNIKPDYLSLQALISLLLTAQKDNKPALIEEAKTLNYEVSKKLGYLCKMLLESFPLKKDIVNELTNAKTCQYFINIYVKLLSSEIRPEDAVDQLLNELIHKILSILDNNLLMLKNDYPKFATAPQEQLLIETLQKLNNNIETLNKAIHNLDDNLQKKMADESNRTVAKKENANLFKFRK